MTSKLFIVLTISVLIIHSKSCLGQRKGVDAIQTGASQVGRYLPLLENKKVALLVNHTSVVGDIHLLDTLLQRGVTVSKIFAPEHGFRGDYANGEKVSNEVDDKTGLPIISLYGKNKKPTIQQLVGVDVVVFDIQDVGVRFYTYISTMHYMMATCAASNTKMIILDRPNPNSGYIDGPVLRLDFQSFVGMHPIPIVYGMTIGELAKMIKGESWNPNTSALDLEIISLTNWTHRNEYVLSIAPSPNLPNQHAILWYPSLCLFEGTNVSVGRGTLSPFQMIGHPKADSYSFSFVPTSIPNISKYPKHEGQECYGIDLRKTIPKQQLDLSYLIAFYQKSVDKSNYFIDFFSKLAGTDELQMQIESGKSALEIRDGWTSELNNFRRKRAKYLIYED